MRKARDTVHEVHVIETDRRGFDALEAHLRETHERLVHAIIGTVPEVPSVESLDHYALIAAGLMCGARFNRLCDGRPMICDLPVHPWPEIAHAWGTR